MQVSNDSAVKLIGCRAGATKDGLPWYRVTVADNDGDVTNIYAEPEVYAKLNGVAFGQNCQLVLRVNQGRTGISCRVIDVIMER